MHILKGKDYSILRCIVFQNSTFSFGAVMGNFELFYSLLEESKDIKDFYAWVQWWSFTFFTDSTTEFVLRLILQHIKKCDIIAFECKQNIKKKTM